MKKQYVEPQLDLFTQSKSRQQSKLYEAIDRMNRKYGKGAVGSASEGLRCRAPLWRMKRDKLSGLSTTDWAHLPRAQ